MPHRLNERIESLLYTELGKLGYTVDDVLTRERTSENGSPTNSLVLKATHSDGHTDALKISSLVLFEPAGIDEIRKMETLAQRERDILQSLDHDHIPKYRGFHHFVLDKFIDIDMVASEYIPMQNLEQRIDRNEPLNEKEVACLLDHALDALSAVHKKKILHRDIKPSNILFDGERAYLFDFNFSKEDAERPSSTVLQNYGYYPPDAYLGLQTQSQDLCALGNTAIAAAFAKDIESIREEQQQQPLMGVSLQKLTFSANLKRFLSKLTSVSPAFRYQSAEAALKDLRNLGTISPEDMEMRLTTATRDESLLKLLTLLEKEDPLFHYNVPPKILKDYDDETLIAHLERTYTKPEFVIRDDENVRKYAAPGVRVRARQTYHGAILVKPGDRGETKGSEGDRAKVKIGRKTYLLNPEDIHITAIITKRRAFREDEFTPVDEKELLSEPPEQWQDMKVVYKGKTLYDGNSIPKGAEGIILGTNREETHYYVAWASIPGLLCPLKVISEGQSYPIRGFIPDTGFDESHLNLVFPNHVDYKKLFQQCFMTEEKETKEKEPSV